MVTLRDHSDERFEGRIAGFGTGVGVRIVIGMWERSPFGRFADVMVESEAGHRLLLAPSEAVAEYVSSTYTFDEVRVVGVRFGRPWGAGPDASASAKAGMGAVASAGGSEGGAGTASAASRAGAGAGADAGAGAVQAWSGEAAAGAGGNAGPQRIHGSAGPRRIQVSAGPRRIQVSAGPLDVVLQVGGPTGVGRLLRGVPRAVAVHPLWL